MEVGSSKLSFFEKACHVFLFETLNLDKLEGTPYLYDRFWIFNGMFFFGGAVSFLRNVVRTPM